MFKHLVSLTFVFILGILATSIYADVTDTRTPSIISLAQGGPPDLPSPKDRVSESNILVYNDRVVIRLDNPQWATFTDTNSMDPLIDTGANAIQIVPSRADEIDVGDIVSYRSQFSNGIIIHRVAYKGVDDQGVYFVMKGDNNPSSDPGRVRFDQIERLAVAIIY